MVENSQSELSQGVTGELRFPADSDETLGCIFSLTK